MFDKYICYALYEEIISEITAKVKIVKRNEALKYKPYPLATIDLQKQLVKQLRISGHKVMEIAEKLY